MNARHIFQAVGIVLLTTTLLGCTIELLPGKPPAAPDATARETNQQATLQAAVAATLTALAPTPAPPATATLLPTPPPSPTPVVIVVTATPEATPAVTPTPLPSTPTPIVVVVTATPGLTATPGSIAAVATPTMALTTRELTLTPVPPTPTPVQRMANIIDVKGNTYKIMDLRARYIAGGLWISGQPRDSLTSLVILLYFQENHVTTTDGLTIPFDSMRRLVLRGAPVPDKLQEMFKGDTPISIEMKDGSVILLGSRLLMEMDAKGKPTKETKMDEYRFQSGEVQGEKVTLRGFVGRARTEDGKEGEFYISLDETQRIEFE